jgi:uncharacterized protein YheU (UPF0270 family)
MLTDERHIARPSKIEQVLRQLRDKRAMIVFDQASETWNIIPRQP